MMAGKLGRACERRIDCGFRGE
jgi:hypothetical protein